ncbi:MAG: glycoside hydrolase family 9 protein [Bacteroidota bacterium]|nr:hypothetical protein [Odoribacter sp.]MDP3642577.1 glycoside hydrolase family 9 protein [Bacteroidota bacterium]
MKRFALLFVLLLVFKCNLKSSDLVEVLPLTNQILMLHFDDGYAVYHKKGQLRANEKVIVELLNTTEAVKSLNYLLKSTDDANYVAGIKPNDVGRKTKGTEFTWLCQSWANGCVNTSPDHVEDHWIYLYLAQAMQPGKTYTLETGSLAKNGSQWTFTFDEKKLRSEAIHVNQIGYNPEATEKYAYVYHWAGDKGGINLSAFSGKNFHLLNLQTDQFVFTGKLTFRKSKTNAETGQATETPSANFSAADVYECNFSSFKEPGDYKIVVEGIGSSFPFRIASDLYRDVFYTTIRGLYHNRSGIELKKPYTEFERKAPHNPLITTGFAGKLKYTTSRFIDWNNGDADATDKPAIEAGIKGSIDSWGWYQDAGDWDGYFSHLNVPAMLLFAWQISPENYADGELNIPEGKNGIPDILDEASWLIRYFYRTRQELIKKGFGTGGVGGRVCGDHFGGDGEGKPSYEDIARTWIISGEDPHTTFKYAALAAQLAFCLKTLNVADPEGVDWQKEARETYDWAKANTKVGDESTKPAIGVLLKDIRSFAAASLYQLTGESKYHDQLKTDLSGITSTTNLTGENRWGPFVYATMKNQTADAALQPKLTSAFKTTANALVSTANLRACRWGGDFYMPMLVGQSTTPLIFEIIMGWKLVKDSDPALATTYKTCVQNTADYFLGNNPLNTTWITGLGLRRPERVFHMDSWYNGKDEMAPGITPYGPWRKESYSTAQGPWDMAWAFKSIYPTTVTNWPGHERWFGNSTTPMNAEFTVHQNTIMNAVVYGFLCDKSSGTWSANQRPVFDKMTVKKINPETASDNLIIEASVSDADANSRIYKVEFFDTWHKIGEAFEAPFKINWTTSGTNNFELTAKVYDELGAIGKSTILKRANIITALNTPEKADPQLKIYPNPTNGQINFQFQHVDNRFIQLTIYNTEGKLIKKFAPEISLNGSTLLSWNPQKYNCPEGLYLYNSIISLGDVVKREEGKIVYQKN